MSKRRSSMTMLSPPQGLLLEITQDTYTSAWMKCGAILRRPQLISPQSSSTCMAYEKTQTVRVS